jgi:hypothetical protein
VSIFYAEAIGEKPSIHRRRTDVFRRPTASNSGTALGNKSLNGVLNRFLLGLPSPAGSTQAGEGCTYALLHT